MRIPPRTKLVAALRTAAAALAAVVVLGARPLPVHADAGALKTAWEEAIQAAHEGDEARVKEFLTATVMKEEDFVAVFKDETLAKEVAARYAEKYASRWAGDAKNFIHIVKDKGYDKARVVEVTADPKEQTGNDKKVVAALKPGTKMYAVHIVKGDSLKGRRYDSFFHVNGRWVTGLKLAALMAPAKDEPKHE